MRVLPASDYCKPDPEKRLLPFDKEAVKDPNLSPEWQRPDPSRDEAIASPDAVAQIRLKQPESG